MTYSVPMLAAARGDTVAAVDVTGARRLAGVPRSQGSSGVEKAHQPRPISEEK
jgi:hypothetical protein